MPERDDWTADRFDLLFERLRDIEQRVSLADTGAARALDEARTEVRRLERETSDRFARQDQVITDLIRSGRADFLKLVVAVVGPSIAAAGAIIVAVLKASGTI